MKYRVHRLEVKDEDIQIALQQFINDLGGEVISIKTVINKRVFPKYIV